MLLGKPVAMCPSMPSIGTSGSPLVGSTPIAFGDFGRFGVRLVKDAFGLQRRRETAGLAEHLQVGFKALLRQNAGVLWTSASSPVGGSPIKYLQNATS
jgi:HK97 family phage major capsid protein